MIKFVEHQEQEGRLQGSSILYQALQVLGKSTDIMVRGGGPNENGFLIDNVYIPSISHFNQPDGRSNGPVGLINTELVETMDFYSNGFSPQYGNKLSSFGDISYREGNKESIEGNIGLGLGGAGGVLEGPITKRSSFLSSFR